MSKENKTMSGGKILAISVLAAILLGFIASVIYIGLDKTKSEDEGRVMAAPVSTELDASTAKNNGNTVADRNYPEATPVVLDYKGQVTTGDLSELVDEVMPAVVMIECDSTYKYYSIFGGSQVYKGKSSGSGFVIGQNGDELLIATNNHVVEDSEAVHVTFCDGKSADASIKGSDAYYDLAVISVDMKSMDAETIKAIKIAVISDADNLEVGAMAIAIGNALGYGQSMTVGYISALDRTVTVDNREMKLVQTDAAINPGNSGGPLLNVRGEVIGINSVKFADSSVEGMGYAIPMSTAVPVINELMNRVELRQDEIGYVGIVGTDVTSAYAKSFNMPTGVYVSKVDRNSPALAAGISVGDIIVAVDGRKVSTMEQYKAELKYKKAGTTVELTVKSLSEGEYVDRKVSVVLGRRP